MGHEDGSNARVAACIPHPTAAWLSRWSWHGVSSCGWKTALLRRTLGTWSLSSPARSSQWLSRMTGSTTNRPASPMQWISTMRSTTRLGSWATRCAGRRYGSGASRSSTRMVPTCMTTVRSARAGADLERPSGGRSGMILQTEAWSSVQPTNDHAQDRRQEVDAIRVTDSAVPPFKRMKLRYAGACRVCGVALAAGETAVYHRVLKQVECTTCFGDGSATSPLNEVVSTSTGVTSQPGAESLSRNAEPNAMPTASSERMSELDSGTAGASARREHERRVAKREDRIRTRHPRLGGLILAVTDEPQSTRAWERGAVGEEKLARRLDELLARGARVLHDRRIPGTRANIDHIVVGPAGIFVIDAKRYKGGPHLRVEGGIFRPRTEKLMVGSRDCSKLVPGVARQVDL